MTVSVTWGHGIRLKCEVQEIEPEGDCLMFQNQYKFNTATNKYDRVLMPSPPLGMILRSLNYCSHKLNGLGLTLMDINGYRKKYNNYLDQVLEKNFKDLPEGCFRGFENEVQRELLHSIHEFFLSIAVKDRVGFSNP